MRAAADGSQLVDIPSTVDHRMSDGNDAKTLPKPGNTYRVISMMQLTGHLAGFLQHSCGPRATLISPLAWKYFWALSQAGESGSKQIAESGGH
jgi:hypothetical protein